MEVNFDIDDFDQFGVPFSRSFVPEFTLLNAINGAGLTLSEASILRKNGKLQQNIVSIWNKYDQLQTQKAKLRDEDLG